MGGLLEKNWRDKPVDPANGIFGPAMLQDIGAM